MYLLVFTRLYTFTLYNIVVLYLTVGVLLFWVKHLISEIISNFTLKYQDV